VLRAEKDRKKEKVCLSFYLIILGSVLVGIGLLLGSFVKGTVFLASIGSFVFLVGIVYFIIQEFRRLK